MSTSTIQTDLGILEYNVSGKGFPILFLHGGHSNCEETMAHKGFDQTRYQLITPSRPGYGNTPLTSNKTALQAANLCIALLDRLGLGKVIVYGISAGGPTALSLAANYPDRVEKLVLASAVTQTWPESKVYKLARLVFHPTIEWCIWRLIHIGMHVFPLYLANFFFRPSQRILR
ncbi:alpha/beta hydrolase [Cytophagaceae bacterium DM2B3-1]|uniref:Alpha/beta hydrolase n=1 Tax=Xanthocytophaga flava TaxID=3048013 RepID=A0ABT7CY08_9BACT|nr:alpha/beta hydrolase [Xanthocytophaga flavus]MDJ1498660.1 alpha/beta hydrolase [Xanthocytophaga flavus]